MGLFKTKTNDIFTVGVCLVGLASYSCNRHSTFVILKKIRQKNIREYGRSSWLFARGSDNLVLGLA